MTISCGAILRDKYRLDASIGRGGMGEVFEAADLTTGQRVAIKVVRHALVDEMLMARLHREAEAARRIKSECVPILYEVDYAGDGELFLVMELLRGETLAERLRKRNEPMTWDQVRRIGEDVLRGLIDAHAARVIHRDLKPGNIFLESPDSPGGERARVLDFGVCKLDTHDGESLTSTGEAVGTISYMAPEQIRGASRVDERADVYSFGTVVFEALSGRLAHDASGQIAMIASKLERRARNLRDVARVSVPAGLDALLARCLAREVAERPASAVELLRAWRALGPATQPPKPSNPRMLAVMPALANVTHTALTSAPATRGDRRGTRAGVVVAACALVASSVVLVVGLRLHAAPSAASGESSPNATTAAPALSSIPSTVVASVAATGLAPAASPVVARTTSQDVDAGLTPSAPRAQKPSTPIRGHVSASGAAKVPPKGPQISVQPRY